MCRLAYIKRPFQGMTEWLRKLEQSAGGDGNGIAVGDRCIKGVKISVEETVQALHDMQPRKTKKTKRGKKIVLPALWHTRRTSSGGDHDALCHPHPCDGGWLVHNGHWQWAHEEALKVDNFGPMSDTRLFATVVDRDGFEVAVKEHQPPGVWLHMQYDGKLAVWLGSGDLWYCPALGAWGSEPAAVGGRWTRLARGWRGYGDKPKKRDEAFSPMVTRYVYHDDHESDNGGSSFSDHFSWWR
jgi:hypothetical protein